MAEIQKTLQALTETIGEAVNEAISNKTVQPEEELFWQLKVNEFEYNDLGSSSRRAEGNYVVKQSWFRASIALQEQISQRPAFESALEELKHMCSAVSDVPSHLEKFVGTVLGVYLENSKGPNSSAIGKIIARFINDLAGGPVTYKAKAELQGVTLRAEKVSLDVGISIRQPKKEDLEVTMRPIGFHQPSLPNPSAIVDIEFSGTRGQNPVVQAKVEQCVALLRLFDVGSVKWTSYDMESDSVIDWMGRGTLSSGDRSRALETYVIKNEDEARLQTFWRTMSVAMPKDIYDFQKQISHITLAYDRYSDALLHNGIIERRIANGVMGLEALLLDETQELSYRLGVRTSKLLALMGKNPLEVRAVISDAYRIRSAFAHGGHLTYKAKKKLETKYGEVKKLLVRVLDYLRVSIVVMILSHTAKDELIDLIDDALIDSAKHEQLKNRVSGAIFIVAV